MILVYARKNNGRRILVTTRFPSNTNRFHEFDLGWLHQDEHFNYVGGRFVSYSEWWRTCEEIERDDLDNFDYMAPVLRAPHSDSEAVILLDGPLAYPATT